MEKMNKVELAQRQGRIVGRVHRHTILRSVVFYGMFQKTPMGFQSVEMTK